MKSIREVYNELKKYDSENKLTFSDESIELKVSDNYKIIAADDYMSFELKNDPITHLHMNFEETYKYLLDVMEGRRIPPTKKEVKKLQINYFIISIVPITIGIIFCELINTQNIIIDITIIAVFVISFILLIILKKNSAQNKKIDKSYVEQSKHLIGAKILYVGEYIPLSDEWEHEHCIFCFDKISQRDGDLHEGYYIIDKKHTHWICTNCYKKFKDEYKWVDYPIDCEDPDKEKNEVERIVSSNGKRIICILEDNKIYRYEVFVKEFDEYYNCFYWTIFDNKWVSLFDTKEKAIEEALRLYPME